MLWFALPGAAGWLMILIALWVHQDAKETFLWLMFARPGIGLLLVGLLCTVICTVLALLRNAGRDDSRVGAKAITAVLNLSFAGVILLWLLSHLILGG
ncbi:MAG: hypothetical protein ACYTEG_10255 [Planctomycetota bacterium]|jgi:hypothetical protein